MSCLAKAAMTSLRKRDHGFKLAFLLEKAEENSRRIDINELRFMGHEYHASISTLESLRHELGPMQQ